MQRRTLLSALAAAGATTAAPWATAQSTWPDQPLRWIVPYPAGGGTDVLARTVGQKVGELPAGSSEDAVYDLIAAEHV